MSDTNSKPPGSSTGNRVMDFLFERGEFSSPGSTDEIWEDIIDGAIDDQHAVMSKAGMLPPEWKANHERTKREKLERRAAKSPK